MHLIEYVAVGLMFLGMAYRIVRAEQREKEAYDRALYWHHRWETERSNDKPIEVQSPDD